MEKASPRPNHKKVIFITLGIIASILVVVGAACGYPLWWFGNEMCGNQVFQEIYSPDSQYKVVIFQRDCGATTGFSTQLSILKAEEELSNTSGNILVLDGHPKQTQIQVDWQNARSVDITYADGYKVHHSKNTFRDFFQVIQIKYRVAPQD